MFGQTGMWHKITYCVPLMFENCLEILVTSFLSKEYQNGHQNFEIYFLINMEYKKMIQAYCNINGIITTIPESYCYENSPITVFFQNMARALIIFKCHQTRR